MSHAEHTVPYHGTFKAYAIGFVLSLILTALPFALVLEGSLPKVTLIFAIFIAAIIQAAVHLHYFLHIDNSQEQRKHVLTLAFTGLIMLIFIAGSVWIMYNLKIRMMDDSMQMPVGKSMVMPMPEVPPMSLIQQP